MPGNYKQPCIVHCGPGSSVGIATGYGLDGPGIESRWRGEIFRTCPDRPWGPPRLLFNGYWASILGVKQEKRERNLYQSVPWLNEWSYTSTPPMARTACTEPQCLYKGALYLYLYTQVDAFIL